MRLQHGIMVAGVCAVAAAAAGQPIVYSETDRSTYASSYISREDPDGGEPFFIEDAQFDGTTMQGLFSSSLLTSVSDLGDAASAMASSTSELGPSSISVSASTGATSVGIGSGSASINVYALFTLSSAGTYDLAASASHSGGDFFGGPSGGAMISLVRDTGEVQFLPGFPFPIPIYETILEFNLADSTSAFAETRNLVAGDYQLNFSLSSGSEGNTANVPDSGNASFSMSLVPGPASAVTLGLGALLGFRRRR